MSEFRTNFMTWTTYGTWLPGDARGWRKNGAGNQLAEPLLEAWCREGLREPPLTLNLKQRLKVETVCREHAEMAFACPQRPIKPSAVGRHC